MFILKVYHSSYINSWQVIGWCITIRPRKKNVMLPSVNDPSPETKFKKLRLGMHPIFVRFLRKKCGKCTQMLYFWVLFEKLIKNKFPMDRPKYSEIPHLTLGQHKNFLLLALLSYHFLKFLAHTEQALPVLWITVWHPVILHGKHCMGFLRNLVYLKAGTDVCLLCIGFRLKQVRYGMWKVLGGPVSTECGSRLAFLRICTS